MYKYNKVDTDLAYKSLSLNTFPNNIKSTKDKERFFAKYHDLAKHKSGIYSIIDPKTNKEKTIVFKDDIMEVLQDISVTNSLFFPLKLNAK